MLSTVGNMSAEDATESLTAIINGFGLATDSATHVIDTLDALDLAYATSSSELAEGLKRSASVAKTAGVSFEDLASILTVVSSTTRLSGETIGNGLKSLFSRLQNIKVGKYIDDTGESLNDVEKTLDKLGIKLRDSATSWRDPMEVLGEIGENWEKFTDIDKSAIATSLGGTYQRNTLMSILENWKAVGEAQEVAANSAGTSAQKYDIYLNSMEAHVDTLKTAWAEFLMNLSQSATVNTGIDAITKFIEVMDFLITKTPLGTAAIVALTAALVRLSVVNLANLGTKLIELGQIEGFSKGTKLIDQFTTALKRMVGVAPSARAASEAMSSTAEGASKTGVAGFKAAGGIKALGTALKGLGAYAAVFTVITVAAVLLGKAISHLVNENKDLSDSIEDHKKNSSDYASTIKEQSDELKTNADRIKEIQKLQKIGKSTAAEDQELKNLQSKNDLLEKQIKLLQLKKDVEDREAAKESNQLFANQFNTGNQTWTSKVRNMFTAPAGRSGVELAKTQVESHNQLVRSYEALQKKEEEVYSKSNSTEKERIEITNRVKEANDLVIKSQQKITDTIEEVQNSYDSLNDSNKKLADGILDAYNGMQLIDSEFATYGDYMNSTSTATGELSSNLDQLEAQLTDIAGMSVKPKDADDMSSWLQSLGEEDLSHLQWVLENAGVNANNLSVALSNMSGADAIKYINNIYEQFNGTVSKLDENYSKLEEALNYDYDSQSKKIAQAYDYAYKSQTKGVQNVQAYKASLETLGLSADQVASKMKNFYKYYDPSTGTAKGDVFKKEVTSALDKLGSKVGTYDASSNKLVINDMSALAKQMGLTDDEFNALIESNKRWIEIESQTNSNALQVALKDAATQAGDAVTKLDEVIDKKKTLDYRTDVNGNISVQFNSEADLSQIGKAVDAAKEKAQNIEKSTGIKIDIPTDIDYDDKDSLSQAYTTLHNGLNSIQNLVDESGNIDISKLQDLAKGINGIEIDADGLIKFSNTDARDKFIEKLKSTFQGVDIGSILKNATEQGQGFSLDIGSVQLSGLDTFTTKASDQIKNSIESAVSAKEVVIGNIAVSNEALSGLTKEGQQAANGVKEAVNKAFESINKKKYSGAFGTTLATQVQKANTQLSSAENYLDYIKNTNIGTKTITIKTVYETVGSPSGTTGSLRNTGTKSTNVPGTTYSKRTKEQNNPSSVKKHAANGLNPSNAEPLRMTRDSNTMVGEEGFEYVIGKHGEISRVGDNGVEFKRLKAGDTVIPHNVSQMLQNGTLNAFRDAGVVKTSTKLPSLPTGHSVSFAANSSLTGTWSNAGRSSTGGVTSLYDNKTIGSTGSSKNTSNASKTTSKTTSTKTTNKTSKNTTKASSGSTKSSGTSSSGSTSTDKKYNTSETNEDAENELKILEHQLNMEYITQKEYAQKYKAIWEKYYKGKFSYRDKDYEMSEKLHSLEKTIFEEDQKKLQDEISKLEYRNDLLGRSAGTEQEQITNYRKMQALYHQMANEYRKRGYADDSEEIRNLSKSWWDLEDKINDSLTSIFNNYISDLDHAIDLTEAKLEQIPEFVDKMSLEDAFSFDELEGKLNVYYSQRMSYYERQATLINAKLVAVNTEVNRLYTLGYEKNKSAIQELQKQAEDLKNDLNDVAEKVRSDNLEKIETSLNHQEVLRNAIKEHVEEEKQKLQDEIDKLNEENDALDKQKQKKELIEALDSAKQRTQRVYHEDTGWVWEADTKKIEEAQEALDDFERQEKIDALQKQIDNYD